MVYDTARLPPDVLLNDSVSTAYVLQTKCRHKNICRRRLQNGICRAECAKSDDNKVSLIKHNERLKTGATKNYSLHL